MMAELSERVQTINAIFQGFERILVILASVATIYIQVNTAAQVERVAEKTTKNYALNTKWYAEKTGEQIDIDAATKAQAKSDDLE